MPARGYMNNNGMGSGASRGALGNPSSNIKTNPPVVQNKRMMGRPASG
jgi:hypothetical protein